MLEQFSASGAQSVTLGWDPSPDTNVVGYDVYYGAASGDYTNELTVGSSTHATISGLVAGSSYYFSVTSYNASDLQSVFSNEIQYSVPSVVTNLPPSLNAISGVTVNENAGPQTVNLSGISSGATNANVTITAVSSNPSVVPNPSVSFTAPSATGSLSFTPVANAYGTATVTVTVNNGQAQNTTVTQTFTVTVNPVFNAPTLSAISGVTINENAGLQTVSLGGIASGSTNKNLTITAVSSNPSVVPNPSVSYTAPSTTGSLSFTPVANAYGTATVTVTVNNGQAQNNTVTQTFTVTVSPVFNAPTLSAISGVTINENAGLQTVNLGGIASGSTNKNLTITAVSSNPSVVPNPSVSYTAPSTTGSLSFTPVANAYGTATVTVTVNNGQAQNNAVTQTFTVTVSQVFNAPTLSDVSDMTINENAGLQTVSLSGIASGSTNKNLTITAVSSNPSVVPNPSVNYTAPSTTGSLSFTPVANAYGTATVTVTVNNGQAQNNTVTQTFTVTVNPVFNAPTLSAISGVTINENAGLQTVTLGGIASGSTNKNLTITAVSSNPSVVPNPSVSYTAPSTTGSLSFTPVANAYGTATVTVTVNNGQAQNNTVTQTFTVTVNPVFNAPTLSDVSDMTINENAGLQTVSLSGIASGSTNKNLTITAVSSNPSVVPNPSVNYTAPSTTGTLSFTPVANAYGSATITLTVNNGQAQNNTVTQTFTVTVSQVFNAPTLSAINGVTINENAGLQTVSLSGIASGSTNKNLTITAVSSNPSVVPNPSVSYTAPSTTGSLSFTPVANAYGTVTVTVTVNNGQAQNNTVTQTFTVTVNPVFNAPTLGAISGVTINENAGLQTVNLSGIASGSTNKNLTITAVSSNPSVVPNPSVSYTAPSTTGSLSFTPVANAYGSATITVTVNNGQAQNNTVTQTFTVTVNQAFTAPTLSPISGVTIDENTGVQAVGLTGISSGTAGGNLTITAVSSNPSVVPNPAVNYTGPSTTGSLSFAPSTNAYGTATITVTADNGQAQNNTVTRTFTVTVNMVGAPTLDALGSLTVTENGGVLVPGAGQNPSPIKVNLTGISAGPNSGNRPLVVTATSSNTGLIPTPTVTYTSPNSTGSLTLLPAANVYGTSLITVKVDDGISHISRSFNLTVIQAGQTPPTISTISNLTVKQYAMLAPVSFTVGDAQVATSNLTLSATSTNETLLPDANITFGGHDDVRTIMLAPASGGIGDADITVTVNDGTLTASTTFHLKVVPVTGSSAVTILVNGQGTVSTTLAGIKPGKGNVAAPPCVSVTACPAAGWYFAGWTGGTNSINATLSYPLGAQMTLVANFLPNVFVPLAGNYNGLFYENDEVRVTSAGFVNISISSVGAYKGTLQIGASTYPFAGQLTPNFSGSTVIARTGANALTVQFQVGQGDTADQISGTVSDGTWTADLQGDRAVFSATTNPSPFAGHYTLMVPSATNNPASPMGDGYGTLTVDGNGLATFTGKLADGSAMSQSVPISKHGEWPLFVPLYGGKGAVVSWLTFSNQPDSDLSGSLNWIKLSSAGGTYYKGGLTNETMAVGSSYTAPAGGGSTLSSTNGMIFFDGADLDQSLTNLITFGRNSQVLNWGPANALSLIMNTSAGSFTGSVTDASSRKTYTFGGVILQKVDAGYGYFLGTATGGGTSVLPTDVAPTGKPLSSSTGGNDSGGGSSIIPPVHFVPHK